MLHACKSLCCFRGKTVCVLQLRGAICNKRRAHSNAGDSAEPRSRAAAAKAAAGGGGAAAATTAAGNNTNEDSDSLERLEDELIGNDVLVEESRHHSMQLLSRVRAGLASDRCACCPSCVCVRYRPLFVAAVEPRPRRPVRSLPQLRRLCLIAAALCCRGAGSCVSVFCEHALSCDARVAPGQAAAASLGVCPQDTRQLTPSMLLQRRDMITRHQFALPLIRDAAGIPNYLSLNPSFHTKQQHHPVDALASSAGTPAARPVDALCRHGNSAPSRRSVTACRHGNSCDILVLAECLTNEMDSRTSRTEGTHNGHVLQQASAHASAQSREAIGGN